MYPHRVENIMEQGKMLVTSIFSLSYDVFNSLTNKQNLYWFKLKAFAEDTKIMLLKSRNSSWDG